MRALSIQVHPGRSADLDVDRISDVFAEIAATDLVKHHQFDRGHDKGPYLNFTFGTESAAALWGVIRARLYDDGALGPAMKAASMAMCSSETGWDDYVLLHHYDATVPIGSDAALGENRR